MSYLETAKNLYREAAEIPDPGLCCTTTPIWALPGLVVPKKMLEMNYGCGTTVHPRDLGGSPRVLYLGVGGGLELLQFSYFSRRPQGVIGVDPVLKMREVCRENLALAAGESDWFQEDFVDLREGDALSLDLEDGSVDLAAQNCLFNIFEETDLKRALSVANRVLTRGGRLVLSGHRMLRNLPLSVCDKTAAALEGRDDLLVTPPTWFYDGGGCC